jgi:hypothetical protein
MGYESETIISVAFSYQLLWYEFDFFCSTSRMEKYTSPDIQDEIINIIKNQIHATIVGNWMQH